MPTNAEVLSQLDLIRTNLQVLIDNSGLRDRKELQPQLDKANEAYDAFQAKVIAGGIVVSDADMQEMSQIKQDVDAAAQKEEIVNAIAKVVAFMAKKMI